MNSRLFTIAAFLLLSASLYAQPRNFEGRPMPPQMKNPEEVAKMKADVMQRELDLSKKQHKKVFKLVKKDIETRQETMMPGGMPPAGGRPEMGGGRPPMGGPGQGGPGNGGPGMGGGRPPMGGPGMGGPGGPDGQRMAPPARTAVDEEYIEKYEKKLKKILGDEKYQQWRKNHPAERIELPPLE